jgi:CubicO group peptidase (beta-lactamase class C family)
MDAASRDQQIADALGFVEMLEDWARLPDASQHGMLVDLGIDRLSADVFFVLDRAERERIQLAIRRELAVTTEQSAAAELNQLSLSPRPLQQPPPEFAFGYGYMGQWPEQTG